MNTYLPSAADDLERMVAAVRRQLHRQGFSASSESALPSVCLAEAVGDVPGAVVVNDGATARNGAVVAAAVDDDPNSADVVRYGAVQARRLGVPLRVVHVWTGRAVDPAVGRTARHDRMSDADLLLSEVLSQRLTSAQAAATEREILHDPDVSRALIGLSAEAVLLVVAARSAPAAGDEPLGGTVRAIVGRTACPLAVLAPSAQAHATQHIW